MSVCELTRENNNYNVTILPEVLWQDANSTDPYAPIENDEFCSGEAINPTVFINTFIIGASCLIGNVLSSVLAKHLSLKFLTGQCKYF